MDVRNSSAKVYPLSPFHQGMLIGGWLAVTLPFAIAAFLRGDAGSSAMVLVITLMYLPLMAVAGVHSRLVLAPEGLEIYQLGYSRLVRWEDVAELRLTPGGEGLVLHNPSRERGAYALVTIVHTGRRYIYDDDQLALIKARRYIPLEMFSYWFRHGDLLDEIERCRPALVRK